MRASLSPPRVLLPHTCTQDGWFLQPKRRPARLPRRAVPLTVYVGVVECASTSPYTYSTHRFPDERTPIEATSFRDICGAWVGFGSGFGIGFTLLLTRSSPSRHPPFTQYPSPSRSLVRDGQTSPHKPGLVVPHSTCPSLSPSPPAHSFIIGPAVINTHT
jgi:hypothetical protein